HEGAYDFTRYTRTGHRRLLRGFDELGSGAVSGPAVALVWSVRYLAVTLAGGSPRARRLADLAARLLTVWLLPLDRLPLRPPPAAALRRPRGARAGLAARGAGGPRAGRRRRLRQPVPLPAGAGRAPGRRPAAVGVLLRRAAPRRLRARRRGHAQRPHPPALRR